MKRDQLKEPYILIQCDYEGCLGYDSEDKCSMGCDDDDVEIYGYMDTPFTVPGIEEWCYQWSDITLAKIHNKPIPDFAKDWNARGKDLAQRLRQIMPEEVNLYYFDEGDYIEIEKVRTFSISADVCRILGVSNICDEEVDKDDTFLLGDFLPIHIPGLFEWQQDFEGRTNFAQIPYINPDYDWATWYARGLQLAKQIRKAIHPTIQLWYRVPFELGIIFPVKDVLIRPNGSCLVRDRLTYQSEDPNPHI